jgi:hypothetical protein
MFHARPARKVRAYRPCLEVLEDRNLLSTYLVDRLTDTGVGSGLAGDLRYCVTRANANPPNNTITFGVTGTINLTGALPTLTHGISIEGPGANLVTVDGGSRYHAFQVAASGSAAISGLTVANDYIGVDPSLEVGGSLFVSDCAIAGGVDGSGSSTIVRCTVGSISNVGLNSRMTVVNSTITNATETTDATVTNYGHLTLTNSTVSGNNVGPYVISNYEDLTISSCTISGNTVGLFGYTGYGLYNYDFGTVLIRNTIIAGNYDSDYLEAQEVFDRGDVQFVGPNLIGGDPKLGDLQDNGGPTFTMAPLPGSPALNLGSPYDTTDQRGVVRTGGTNIGAYQASASVLTLTGLPTFAVAGTALSATITAKDIFGQTAVGYTGTVHFSSTDGQAVLPNNYTFTSSDAGQHTFPAGVTLKTAGNRTVTATDTVTGSITGSGTVTVTPAAADHLVFLQQPTDTAAGQMISPVVVEVVDAFGNVETSDNSDTITLSIGTNPSGGTLDGTLTLTVVNGVATFSDLSIDLAGMGYTLHASIGGGLPDTDSNPFNVTM